MSQQELLREVIATLERCGIGYMITGSIASSLQGEPRSTHDIDVLVAIQAPHAKALVQAFRPPDYYLDEGSIQEAVASKSMFNLIDVAAGGKVDFWILTDEPFDRSRFSRRYAENVTGMKIQVSTPEDTILAKLRWAAKSGGSEKQFTDALRVFEVQYEKLDQQYLEKWAAELNVGPLWRRLKQEAEIVTEGQGPDTA